mmetsp:Transcript_7069/g.14262  ORF Transcript_7069/g.14262 Transcript_7069/m.14262 type:complete len:341 (-) Transcript_7069:1601-2623(-)
MHALHALRHLAPVPAVVRLRGARPLEHVLLLVLVAVLALELIRECPEVADVRVEGHRAVEPVPRLLHLAVVPEELGDGGDDVGVVVAPPQRVHALGLALRLRRHRNALRPQHARGRALLQRLGHEALRHLVVVLLALGQHGQQPQLVLLGVLQAALLQQRTRLRYVLGLLLRRRGRRPQRHLLRALAQAQGVGLLRPLHPTLPLLQLPQHQPHLPRQGVLGQALPQEPPLLLAVAQLALHHRSLHPHALRAPLLARFGEDEAGALRLLVLKLQLERRQPHLLRVGVRRERLLQDGAGAGDVPGEPLLLRAHEPEDLRLRAIGHRLAQQLVQQLRRPARLL